MGKLTVKPLRLEGTFLVETNVFKDHRGIFARFFCQGEMKEILGNRQIVNVNFSKTMQKGSVRGLHYQTSPFAEMKMIRCIKGKVWDVMVDIRKGSPTFLHWDAIELSGNNMRMVVIPEGFAHGFQILEEDSDLLYLHTNFYHSKSEGALNIYDKALNISCPLPVSDMSERDKNHPMIDGRFKGIEL